MTAPFSPLIPFWLLEARLAEGKVRIASNGLLQKLCRGCNEWKDWHTGNFGYVQREPCRRFSNCKSCARKSEQRSRQANKVTKDDRKIQQRSQCPVLCRVTGRCSRNCVKQVAA